jgi:hypothetical protein
MCSTKYRNDFPIHNLDAIHNQKVNESLLSNYGQSVRCDLKRHPRQQLLHVFQGVQTVLRLRRLPPNCAREYFDLFHNLFSPALDSSILYRVLIVLDNFEHILYVIV